MTVVMVPAKAVAEVAGCMSTEETRYYLGGVCIEGDPQGLRLVATDGHRLMVMRPLGGIADGPLKRGEVILSWPKGGVLRQAVKPVKGDGERWLRLDIEAGRLDVVQWGGSVTREDLSAERLAEMQKKGMVICTVYRPLIDGTFPDWRRVCPPLERAWAPHAKGQFNVGLLDAFRALLGKHEKLVEVFGMEGDSAGHDPHLVRVPSRPEVFGIVMPMRSDRKALYPEWHAEQMREDAAAKAAVVAGKEG